MVVKIGVIGGYSNSGILKNFSEEPVCENSVCLKGILDGKEIYIISRHGKNHVYPPHRVPLIDYFEYLKKRGVKDLITVYSVGVLNRSWEVPCLVLINDFIDFTGELVTRHNTFENGPIHAEMDEPYYKPYQKVLTGLAEKSGLPLYHGVYFQMVGPRLETRAEIRAANVLGGDVIGMTHSWEAILAREYGMRLVSLAMGVNYASGIAKLDCKKIIEQSENLSGKTNSLLRSFIQEI